MPGTFSRWTDFLLGLHSGTFGTREEEHTGQFFMRHG